MYSAITVWDMDGNIHDFHIMTNSYTWPVRLRAVRRECDRRGINYREAYIGGNIWTRYDIINA